MYFLWDIIFVKIYCYIVNDSRENRLRQGDLMEILVTKLKQNYMPIWGYFTMKHESKTEKTTAEEHCWDLWMV